MPPPLRAAAGLGIAYRPMTDADLPFIAALYASTREEELAPVPWPPEAKRAFLAQQFNAQHTHYQAHYSSAEWLIIERGGEPIGRLYLEERDADFRVIDIALVAAAQRNGIGGAIMRDVLALAGEAGKGVSIHVEKNNPARRLYDRLGFTVAADAGVYDRMEWDPPAVL